MAFEYTPVDFSEVRSVEIQAERPGTRRTGSSDSSTTLTKEQRRKRQLVEYKSDAFDAFEEEIEFLHSLITSDPQPEEALDALGLPDYITCANCNNLREGSGNSEDYCHGAGRTIPDDGPRPPSFCSPDLWSSYGMSPSREVIVALDDSIVEYLSEGYEERAEQQRETYEQRREQAIEEGNFDSGYVTGDIDEMVDTELEYVQSNARGILGRIINGDDWESARPKVLEYAWAKHIHDEINDEFYPNTAEAYLRAMDSPFKSEVNPGEGGREFEQNVRDLLSDAGFPLGPRVFHITEQDGNSWKEMDFNTQLDDRSAVVEAYTYSGGRDKERQLADYCRLYELATGETPHAIHLSQHTNMAVTGDLLQTLIEMPAPDCAVDDHSVVTNSSPRENQYVTVQDSESFETVEPGYQEGSYQHSDVEVYDVPPEALEAEERAVSLFEACGFTVRTPLVLQRQFRNTYYPLPPVVRLASGGETVWVALRSEHRPDRSRDEVDGSLVWHGMWSCRQAMQGLLGTQNVTAVTLLDDSDDQSQLTPWAFYTFLSVEDRDDESGLTEFL